MPNIDAVKFLRYLLLSTVLLWTGVSCNRSDYVSFSGYAQGGTYTVKIHMDGVKQTPEAIHDSVERILTEIDTTLSGYNKGSMLSRFNRGEAVVPSEMFLELYDFSRRYFEMSEGALDVAAGPVFNIWGFGFTTEEMPSQARIDSVLALSGMKRLVPSLRTVVREDGRLYPGDAVTDGGAPPILNYNAVAQGYSCDRVARYLYSIGVKDMLVDIGEIYCDGVNPSGKPWTVGVDSPVDGNNTPGRQLSGILASSGGPQGIVTSGNYRKFYIRDGHKYGHTLDPRTGYPAQDSLLSATIIAPTAADADATATWAMVLGFERAKALIQSREDLEGLLIYAGEGEEMKQWASPGMNLQ